jgi:hypothetical protein
MHEPDDPELPTAADLADAAGADPDAPPMTAAEAEQFLAGVPLVPALSGSIPEMKALRARCLAAGIPALVGCPPGAGKG